jgi:hypothetical protein
MESITLSMDDESANNDITFLKIQSHNDASPENRLRKISRFIVENCALRKIERKRDRKKERERERESRVTQLVIASCSCRLTYKTHRLYKYIYILRMIRIHT